MNKIMIESLKVVLSIEKKRKNKSNTIFLVAKLHNNVIYNKNDVLNKPNII